MTAKEILSALSIEDKAKLCSGVGNWNTYACESKGLKTVSMADGPTGLRKEQKISSVRKRNLPATCFPTAVTTASSWDPKLIAEVSAAIAQECKAEGVNILLAPGTNIKRSPLCGRNFEYISEDPYLAGTMAAAYIDGLQKNGIGASLKHFAVNSQEMGRLKVSAQVDERALREIYLRPFEIAVKTAKPYTIMSCYNRVNGEYVGESKKLLNDILRGEWKYKGVVESDWLAVNDRVKALKAGMNLEMPSSGGNGTKAILDALESGELTEAELDKRVLPLIELSLKFADAEVTPKPDLAAQHLIAKKALVNSAVLMKNGGALPYAEKDRVAVIGALADKVRFQGGGSSNVNAYRKSSFLDALNLNARSYAYEPGYTLRNSGYNKKLIDKAVALAKANKKAIVFVGLTDEYECEGFDRVNMRLPYGQLELIKALLATGCRLSVVLMCGSPVELPFVDEIDALLNVYLGGQAVGEGIYDLIFGIANPSGKLAETFPVKLEDNINHHYFPMGPHFVEYRESIFVGYRYFDTAKKEVAFPFGHGLSYTKFTYSDLVLDKETMDESESLKVKLTVKNTGNVAGAEIVQLYVADKKSTIFRPAKELKAFTKIMLEPGAKKTVTFTLKKDAFAFYNVNEAEWQVESGTFEILVGASSRDIRLKGKVKVNGNAKNIPDYRTTAPIYFCLDKAKEIPKKQFEAVYNGELPENKATPRGEFDRNSSLHDFRTCWFGKGINAALKVGGRFIYMTGADAQDMRKRFETSHEIPVIRMAYQSGTIDRDTLNAVLDMANNGIAQGVAKLIADKKNKKD